MHKGKEKFWNLVKKDAAQPFVVRIDNPPTIFFVLIEPVKTAYRIAQKEFHGGLSFLGFNMNRTAMMLPEDFPIGATPTAFAFFQSRDFAQKVIDEGMFGVAMEGAFVHKDPSYIATTFFPLGIRHMTKKGMFWHMIQDHNNGTRKVSLITDLDNDLPERVRIAVEDVPKL